MATVTKPIALDESLNTTEQTPRNIADVLAQELSRITGRNASQVEYDNTESGLTADNVQDALDEIAESVPTLPTTDIQTAVDEFETYNGGLLSECKVTLEPIQDLHGYPNPWVGGASKNIIPMTVDAIKTLNSAMPWVDKVATVNGVTITILTDSADNIIGFDVDGTASLRVDLHLGAYTANGNYTISGSTNGSMQKWAVWSRYHGTVESEISLDGAGTYYDVSGQTLMTELTIFQGVTTSHQKFYPMLCLSSAPDPTVFAPYTNICPINGHIQVEVDVSDGQTTQEQVTVNLGGTYYSGTLDVVSGVFTPDTAFDILSADNFNDETGTSGGGLYYYDWNNGLSKKSGICICSMMPQNNALAWQSTTPCIQMSSGGGRIRCYVEEATKEAFKTAYSGMQICYELANPTPIQLSPTTVKALVGENHLSAPLDGQEITESKYKQMFTFDDVIAYIQSLS